MTPIVISHVTEVVHEFNKKFFLHSVFKMEYNLDTTFWHRNIY